MSCRIDSRWLLALGLLLSLLLVTGRAQALSCVADPGDEGTAIESGTPGPLLYFRPSGSVNAGDSSITLTSTAGLAAGDMVLVIQMQGAGINSTNSNSYGDGVAGDPASGFLNDSDLTAGRFEYAAVASVAGNTINLATPLVNNYVRANASGTIGQRRYQVIRVPQYFDLTLAGDITAPAWNGETGGVLPLDVANTLDFNGYSVDVSGKGFRGGGGYLHTGAAGRANSEFRSPSYPNDNNGAHASKGEGIAGTPRYVYTGSGGRQDTGVEGYPNGSYAMGAPGTAGGGGTDGNPSTNGQNAGGGGGNGGAGGRGGNSWDSNLPVGGFGGAAFPAQVNRLVMGGGGGAGTGNNGNNPPPHGGVGGGIVLIRAGQLAGNGIINVNGADGVTPNPANDAGGGGGAGGSVLVLANSQSGALTISARGGAGGNADPGGDTHGPGGGGGGGAVFINDSFTATIDVAQGPSGYTVSPGIYYGASPSGNIGSGVPDADPADVDGVSPGADCITRSDLAVSKTRSSGLLIAGQPAQFRIQVSNNGPAATLNTIEVTDVLDSRFSYTGFSGSGWTCSESPAQTISCSHAGPLANGASLPDLLIDVDVGAAGSGSQAVDNTATVTLASGNGNFDDNSSNNSSTLSDTIYGATISGNKRLYLYPTSTTAGTLSRTVQTNGTNYNIDRGNGAGRYMQLTLSPVLSDDFTVEGDMAVRLCMRRTNNNSGNKTVRVEILNGNTAIGDTGFTEFVINSNGWGWREVSIALTGTSTFNAGDDLHLRISNRGNDSGNNNNRVTLDPDGSNCGSTNPPAYVEFNSSTVINIDSVDIYDAAHPAGNLISRMVESATVYVRSTVTDPFGFADINNDSSVEVLDNGGVVVSGPHAQTAVLSEAGNSKVFEYAVPLPADWQDGPYTLRVRANEGTEGTVSHFNATGIEVTGPPLLMVSKLAGSASAAPGDDIDYQVVVSNTHVLGTGDAINVRLVDRLPPFTAFKLGSLGVTDGPTPYDASGLTVASIEYSNDGAVSWAYTPVSEAGGAPPGFDATVTHLRVVFSGIMPPNGGLRVDYSLRLN